MCFIGRRAVQCSEDISFKNINDKIELRFSSDSDFTYSTHALVYKPICNILNIVFSSVRTKEAFVETMVHHRRAVES